VYKKFIQPMIFILALLVMAIPHPALADGIIIPPPPICDPGPCPPPPMPPMRQLVVRYHHVQVTIEDQVAVTHVDQVFYNPNDWAIEGTYMFPLPQGAVVTSFTLWVDGEPVEGKVLDATQARQAYEEIVRSLRDPALLEYAGTGAVQAKIFPISPGGERRVELEYTQALTADNGLVTYTYPLNTEKFSAQPLESVSVTVDIKTSMPIRAVYSPTHDVAVSRDGDFRATVGYEASQVTPDSDFSVLYSTGENEAFHLLSYRNLFDPTDPDGYFLLLLAAKPEASQETLAKDVILVLDRSGSMEGAKFEQAQAALEYILKHLNPEDRFNIIVFGTALEEYASQLRPASETSAAQDWVSRQSARGSTNINHALLTAASYADPERPTYVIFLTDGLPTVGEVDSAKILANFKEAAPENLRLFAFGVGYDVDTYLLDSLAQEHHGTTTYVLPDQRLDETISAFYEKVSTPVLTDLKLDFGSLEVYDLFPEPLPDLFRGSQIIVAGRYRKGGDFDVTLTGEVNGEQQSFHFPQQSFTVDSRGGSGPLAAIPRLWATRKIGYLLNQIRLIGPDKETIDQIVRLSIRFGIVTPYTSYLVTEDKALGAEARQRIVQEQYSQLLNQAPAPASGQEAVRKSADEASMAGAESIQVQPAEAAGRVKAVGPRTFLFTEDKWVDTGFDPQSMQPVKVAFLSDDYFRLLEVYPDLAAAFALGPKVIALADGVAYEVVAEGAEVAPLQIITLTPPTLEPGLAPTLPIQSTPAPDQPTEAETQAAPTQTFSPAATIQPAGQPAAKPLTCFPGGLALIIALIVYIGMRRVR
jgi:Ca-activated chloride channel family protein